MYLKTRLRIHIESCNHLKTIFTPRNHANHTPSEHFHPSLLAATNPMSSCDELSGSVDILIISSYLCNGDSCKHCKLQRERQSSNFSVQLPFTATHRSPFSATPFHSNSGAGAFILVFRIGVRTEPTKTCSPELYCCRRLPHPRHRRQQPPLGSSCRSMVCGTCEQGCVVCVWCVRVLGYAGWGLCRAGSTDFQAVSLLPAHLGQYVPCSLL